MTTEKTTNIQTCGHAQETVPAFACAGCGRTACDDCGGPWAVCAACCGAICDDCLAKARWRRRYARHVTTEWLCAPCAAREDSARHHLATELARVLAECERDPRADGTDWLDQLVAELKDALAEAERAGGL